MPELSAKTGARSARTFELAPLDSVVDVWSEVTVRYTGGLEINGELKEPGVGTKKMQCFLFKDRGVSHPTRFTVRGDTKLSLRNIRIRKL